jgi:hypothetical protein
VHGSVTVDPSGMATYTPAAGYSGVDSFDYTVDDGRGGTATGTVSLTVEPKPNSAPSAASFSGTVAYDQDATFDLGAHASDPDGDPLSYGLGSGPAHGSLTLDRDGTATYRPAAGYSGSDSFEYTVDDGRGGTATGTVSLTVDPKPDSLPSLSGVPSSLAIADDGKAVLTIPADPDGDPLTITATATAGSVAVRGSEITYTPVFGSDSTSTIHYTVSDGTLTESGTTEVTATAPHSTITVTNGHMAQNSAYLPVRPKVAGIPAGRNASITLTVNGMTADGFANNDGEACPNFADGATTITCTVTGAGSAIELGHYDPYADSITVTVTPIDFVAPAVTTTLTRP